MASSQVVSTCSIEAPLLHQQRHNPRCVVGHHEQQQNEPNGSDLLPRHGLKPRHNVRNVSTTSPAFAWARPLANPRRATLNALFQMSWCSCFVA